MDAYEILQKIPHQSLITEKRFDQLRNDFQSSYLTTKKYYERIELHRNPIEVKHEVLNDLNSYLVNMQGRAEVLDIDKNAQHIVFTQIRDLWREDKRLKTLYCSTKQYCESKTTDFNTIAVHVAEYRALSKLFHRIRNSINIDKVKNFDSKKATTGVSINLSKNMLF